jgi:anoctamin-10
MVERAIHVRNASRSKLLVDLFPFHNKFALRGTRRMEDKDLKKVQVINQLKGDQLAHDDIFADEIPKGLTKYWRGIIHCPATKIRDYFGEKIAMYFSFLSYYTFYLIFPGVLGIPVFICQFWPRATWN